MEKQMKNTIPATSITRPQRPKAPNWQYYSVATLCCAVLVAGFFFAARQHFSSMEYGLQNSKLRRDLDALQTEQRRLLLNREIAISPAELKKAVKRIGYIDTPASQAVSIKDQNPAAQRSVIKTVEEVRGPSDKPANKIVRTAMVSPVNKLSSEKQDRRDNANRKKDRT